MIQHEFKFLKRPYRGRPKKQRPPVDKRAKRKSEERRAILERYKQNVMNGENIEYDVNQKRQLEAMLKFVRFIATGERK